MIKLSKKAEFELSQLGKLILAALFLLLLIGIVYVIKGDLSDQGDNLAKGIFLFS